MIEDWTNIDFSPGRVEFIETNKQEDMLQVVFDSKYILDMGWYSNEYKIYIVCDNNWENPVYLVSVTEENELYGILLECKNRIQKML